MLACCKRRQRCEGGLFVLHRRRQSLRRFLLLKQSMNGLFNVLWQPEQMEDASDADAFVMDSGCRMRDTPALGEYRGFREDWREERLAGRAKEGTRPPSCLLLFAQKTDHQPERGDRFDNFGGHVTRLLCLTLWDETSGWSQLEPLDRREWRGIGQ
jgi:hypothetical protein